MDNQKVLQDAENMYAQLVDVYPRDERFLSKYIDILEKLEKPIAAKRKRAKLHSLLLESNKLNEAKRLESEFPYLLTDSASTLPTTEKHTFMPFLSDFNLFDRLVMHMQQKSFKKDACVFKEGEPGDALYIILEGTMTVIGKTGENNKPIILNTLQRGDIVGEQAALTGQPRNATVVTTEDCLVLMLSRSKIHDLIAKKPEFKAALYKEDAFRTRVTQISQNPVLARFSLADRQHLAQHAITFKLNARERITEAGELIKHVILIAEGAANAVHRDSIGKKHVLNTFQAGDMFGQESILKSTGWYYNIFALTDLTALKLPIHVLKDFVQVYPWFKMCLEEDLDQTQTKIMVNIRGAIA